jgi:hypothetical protein
VALLSVATLAAPPSIGATTRTPPRSSLTCASYASNVNPRQRTTLLIYVHTQSKAAITATAHFKTGALAHASRADKHGNAAILFRVGRAMKGYVVHVLVRVTLRSSHGFCKTAFTPR